ncbi:MAG: (deoxy)nucleoside triphosphate pyrophosphohydrolase [Elusimicrobiota bacterium]
MIPIPVTAAVLEKGGKVLIARRAKGRMGGFWEFPGGKLRAGESVQECLAREIREELGLIIEVGPEVSRNVHVYEWGAVELIALSARVASGELTLKDHDAVEWVEKGRLLEYALAPADIPIARVVAG